jgi:trk system potassium uptake protein TrkH
VKIFKEGAAAVIHIFGRRISFPVALTSGFLILIIIGGLLLSLPLATVKGGHTNLSDAFFVATSAVCVTGLTTVVTATHWSFWGQLILICLVEVGGLGFMTFEVMLSNLLRRRISFTTRILTEEAMGLDHLSQVKLVFWVIRLSLIIQLAGSLLLWLDFGPRYGWLKGLWYSIFHTIAAYCNAGFDLFGPSLVGLNQDSYVLMVIALLICLGSFGFLVWSDLLTYHHTHRLSLHTQLALTSGAIIIVVSIIGFLLSDHNLAQFSKSLTGGQRFANTIFLAITPRTAGFFSIPYNHLSTTGLMITIILMFIGGTPGSTAGGIKTSTISLLALQSWATFRGKEPVFHHRRFTHENIFRALTLFFVAISLLLVASLILLATQPLPSHEAITEVIFEVVSAFGTVGLTLGLTPHLTLLGKFIIMALMFIGRVGIYTFMYSLFRTEPVKERIKYPEEEIMIG